MSKEKKDFIYGFTYCVLLTILTFSLIWLTSIVSSG